LADKMKVYLLNESNPKWDDAKVKVLGKYPNSFNLGAEPGEFLPCEWWRCYNAKNEFIGFGWIDERKGDAEISICIDEKFQNKGGYGTEMLYLLEKEASKRGYKQTVGVVECFNPLRHEIIDWLFNCGYVYVQSHITKAVVHRFVDVMEVTLVKEIENNINIDACSF